MMGHLLGDGAPAEVVSPVALVRLTQERIEGLARTRGRGRVARHRERRHVGHLLQAVSALGRSVEN